MYIVAQKGRYVTTILFGELLCYQLQYPTSHLKSKWKQWW